MILAGDIGGTNVRLAYFEVSGGRLVSTFTEIHPTREFASLEEAARKFLSAHSLKIECACFGVAGAVKHGKVKLTNLPWTLDERLLARNLGVEQMWLINDLEANAEGVAALSPDDFLVLNQGEAGGSDNCAIISAGTGLGEAGLVWDGVRRRPVASEGGHADFSPRTDLDIELLKYLRTQSGQVSWEQVLSGPGLFNLYKFLRDTGRGEEPAWLAAEISQGNPPAVITHAALEGKSNLCVQALDLFVNYYGMEAANLALKFLAVGGIYLGGGIAPKITAKLQNGKFMDAFVRNARLGNILKLVPVHVILNDKTALFGAARHAALQTGQIK